MTPTFQRAIEPHCISVHLPNRCFKVNCASFVPHNDTVHLHQWSSFRWINALNWELWRPIERLALRLGQRVSILTPHFTTTREADFTCVWLKLCCSPAGRDHIAAPEQDYKGNVSDGWRYNHNFRNDYRHSLTQTTRDLDHWQMKSQIIIFLKLLLNLLSLWAF